MDIVTTVTLSETDKSNIRTAITCLDQIRCDKTHCIDCPLHFPEYDWRGTSPICVIKFLRNVLVCVEQ